MNFAEVVLAVIGITKRPDKQAETERAVNAALSYFCLKEKFDKDLIEGSLTINASLYGDTISLASLTRFRHFKYIKVPGKLSYLKKIGSDQIFTPGGSMQKNCYYVAGTNLTYILSSLAPSLEIGYYSYPATLSGSQTHWLLEANPHCVIDKAAADIFKSIGDDASFRIHAALAVDAYDVVVRDLA
jgi:hypothetical protein